MERPISFLIRHRKTVLAVVGVILVLSTVGLVFLLLGGTINSDLLTYLPENTASHRGITFLKEHFGIEGDAFVVVEGEDNDKELSKSIAELKGLSGVTEFVWYGDVSAIETLLELFRLKIPLKTEEVKSYLRQPIVENGVIIGYNYVLLVLFDYSPSTAEAFQIHQAIRAELSGKLGRSVAIAGMTAFADTIMTTVMRELPYYLIAAFLVVILILILTTDSFVEPLILMITLGISILVNMGTNIIFPSVSIVSFAACSVLQLGITMDYAVFLLHNYKKERRRLMPSEAAASAVPRTFFSILISALATMGGFLALYFMSFTLGRDLANVVIKGILLSLLSVVFIQPVLMVMFDRLMGKTAHKTIRISYAPVARRTIKARYVIAIAALLILIPAFYGQSRVQYSYLKIYEESEVKNAQEQLASELQNQVILAVPLVPETGTQKEFMEKLLKDEKIFSVLGLYSVLDMTEEETKDLVTAYPILTELSMVSMLLKEIDVGGRVEYYTLYLVGIKGDTEDAAAFQTHAYFTELLDTYFAESYPLGMLTGTADMAGITPRDFLIVMLVSGGVALLLLMLLLKSVRKAVMTVLLIELAIWLNISISAILGLQINFMIYIILSSVQLGCTVDYAMLLSAKFEEAKRSIVDTKEAIICAVAEVFRPLSISLLIVAGACMSVYAMSSLLIVREMTKLMARGAALSYLIVLLVMPCLLVYFKRITPSYQRLFGKKEETNAEKAK